MVPHGRDGLRYLHNPNQNLYPHPVSHDICASQEDKLHVVEHLATDGGDSHFLYHNGLDPDPLLQTCAENMGSARTWDMP